MDSWWFSLGRDRGGVAVILFLFCSL